MRVCGSGDKQEENVNYFEMFVSAAKYNTIRIVFALAAIWGWDIDQIDVVAAYLNSELGDEVYMEAPFGVLSEEEKIEKVCRLLRTIYGLEQAGRQWYKTLAAIFC